MNKSQFQTKAGYLVKTVERANGNGKIDASKRFYEIFKLKYGCLTESPWG